MLGFVQAPARVDLDPAPKHILLPVEVQLTYHRKYLSPAFRKETLNPDMARQIGEALLAAGAIAIIDHGPRTAADKADGYHTFTVRCVAINPLSPLNKAEL